MLKKILRPLITYFTLGVDENTSINDQKKITLLHIFCNTWHLFTLLTFVEDFYNGRLMLASYAFMLVVVCSVQVLLYRKQLFVASLLFITGLSFTAFIYSNYIYTEELLEYYFLLPPSIALIYVDDRRLNTVILIGCLLGMYLPNLYFNHYPQSVLNNMNPPFLFFSIFIVISYFKNLNIRNEKILETKTKQLQELDAFKSQFFTNISHEIRTPLTLINGYNGDLTAISDSPEIQESQKNIKKQVGKITAIVNSVLDLAKIQSSNFGLELKLTNVSDLIRKQYMNFEPLFHQKKVAFHLSSGTTDHFALTDPVFFEKAINNLIVNALKYTDSGEVAIGCYPENGQLVIKISDTGIGIDESNHESVFTRFYQVNNDINQSGGSGVGLAFCKEIIELHQGRISLKSELNEGSEFIISLPLQATQPKISPVKESSRVLNEVSADETVTLQNDHSGFRFLIVDDNDDMRQYLMTVLSGFHCLQASNGAEALEIIDQNQIDLIITDYMMPTLNGYDLIAKLKEENNDVPVIMLTAKTDFDTKLSALRLGIDDYVTKPFEKAELLVRITNCISNRSSKKSYLEENNIAVEELKEDPFIEQLKEYVMDNSDNTSLNQDMIASAFNVSKKTFYRRVKGMTGLSPNNFIREIRLQKAREMSRANPNLSLKELSFEAGFSHASYFSKMFEKRFGIKPWGTGSQHAGI
ncbi:MAG: response regulator, partial [Bacteroidota bacterium]